MMTSMMTMTVHFHGHEYYDDDNDAQFHSGNHDFKFVPCEWDSDGKPTLYTSEKGPNDTHVFDSEGYTKHQERINNGLRLFGKYYRALWD